ncbi:transmembrane protein 222 isoform X2 [Oncorhynchus kisutch]|uniref:transmembrane protein 222 isoform X2 n=1 Tax=Oncorhynchus kisutch TaxID=8019 RepID=UPI0012DC971D|nr:transmembrane protein 222 isoform X2 [Oncorhynchus kisutch]
MECCIRLHGVHNPPTSSKLRWFWKSRTAARRKSSEQVLSICGNSFKTVGKAFQEDNMAFGRPTKYWMLDVAKVYASGSNAWDTAVHDASEEYKNRMHNLCCDNCHSHVAMALNLMRYENKTSWNMINLCLLSLVHGKHISCAGFLKTWLPFLMLLGIILTVALTINLR